MQTDAVGESELGARPKGRILLVDDSVELVRGLSTLLRNEGYEVNALYTGAGVADAVTLQRPDVVVLDVMMPGTDGWEALRRIRANPGNARVEVMMLTAKNGEDAKVYGLEHGADDYLSKPFTIREFRARIEAMMRRAHRSRTEPTGVTIPVVASPGIRFVDVSEIVYVTGVRNYSYVHTYDGRFLCRQRLGDLSARDLPGIMRVHRSYLVRLGAVQECGWPSRSSFQLVMADGAGTAIPVSRSLVREVRARLGVG